MTDITLEIIRAIVLLGIFVFLWNAGRGRFHLSRQGWIFIILGFGLLLFGSVLDITDNFKSLNRFVVIGDTKAEAFLEKFVGFLGGFFLLAIGLIRWIPRVQDLSDLVEDRTRELHEANKLLVGEITERKEVEKDVLRLAAAIEGLSDSFSLHGADDRLIVCNKNYRILNEQIAETTKPGTLFEDHLRELAEKGLVPEAVKREEEWVQERLARHKNPSGLFEIARQDGRYFLIHEQRLPDGATATIATDITERKNAEEALEESQARLENILDNSPSPIYFKDTEGRFLVANRRYQEMYDVKFEDIKGKTSKEIFGDELGKWFLDHDQEVLNSCKAIERGENIFGRTYLTLKFPILDPTGLLLGLGGIETDITERKQMEEALVESEEKHRDFSSDVAHELRTPLAVMRSYLDNLEKTETIQSLIKDVDDMSRLVSQLLVTTRIDSLTVNLNDEADLHAIGTEVTKYLAPIAIKEGRSIEMTGIQHPVIVQGNGDALEMAVRNLVENAIRYSARETVVTINISDEPAISVIDHGRGIAPEHQKVIFQRFKRADRRSGGAGLGLSIVQRVVEAHLATIDVSDTPGGGTVFKISFPSPKSLKVVAG